MFYLFSEPVSDDTEYVQLKIESGVVVASPNPVKGPSSWSSSIENALSWPIDSERVKDQNWQTLPELLEIFTLVASSPTRMTTETHPELLI